MAARSGQGWDNFEQLRKNVEFILDGNFAGTFARCTIYTIDFAGTIAT